MNALHDALFTELSSDSSIAEIVGSGADVRIWRAIIPQRVKAGAARYPCLVITVANTDRQKAYCGTVGTVEARVQIDSYAANQEQAWALANEVRSTLLDFRGMLGGTLRVKDATLESEGELADLEPGTYRVLQSWQIWHYEG